MYHAGLIEIPLRPDVTIKIHMPRDITKAEAEKVAKVIAALGTVTR